ncbi:hypothetical protein P7C73_g58, partial [Tremellales sp. Uapishka_1]
MPASNRKNPTRQAPPQVQTQAQQTYRQDFLSDFQARRIARRLEDLERTNPHDIPATSFVPQPSSSTSATPTTSVPPKKKQSANVRRILNSKKSLKDWLDELVGRCYRRESMIDLISAFTFITAVFISDRSAASDTLATSLLVVWLRRRLQVPEMCGVEL